MTIKRFECQKCGNCCRNTKINICYSDIERWKRERRGDILTQICWVKNYETGYLELAFVKTLPKKAVCPFLSKTNICEIHDTKPRVCKDFPIHGTAEKQSQCEGIGRGPRLNQKNLPLVIKRQIEDLAKVIVFRTEISTVMLESRFTQFMLEKGYGVFDESTGKYRPTQKGLKFLEKAKKKMERIARQQNKTIQQLSQEATEQIFQFRLFDKNLVKKWQRSRKKQRK